MIKKEMDRFERTRVKDFKETLVKYLEALMLHQQQVQCKLFSPKLVTSYILSLPFILVFDIELHNETFLFYFLKFFLFCFVQLIKYWEAFLPEARSISTV